MCMETNLQISLKLFSGAVCAYVCFWHKAIIFVLTEVVLKCLKWNEFQRELCATLCKV